MQTPPENKAFFGDKKRGWLLFGGLALDSHEEEMLELLSHSPKSWVLIDVNLGAEKTNQTLHAWQFFVTFLGWLSDPFKGLSDLQLGDEKVTLNHLVCMFHYFFQFFSAKWIKK